MSISSEKPLVSVVIPTYRRPIYLERAIESARCQSYQNIEIIVVDDNDANTEFRSETEKLMNNYANTANILYLKHEFNKNGAAARNTGLKKASGDYITFLDDDDEMLPERLESQIDLMERLDKTWGACYTKYKKIKGNNEILVSSENRQGNLYIQALMRSIYIGSGSNLLIRKNIAEAVSGYDESFNRNQDLEFLARILEKHKLAFIDECTLIIHYEVREKKDTYEGLLAIDEFYLNRFGHRIEQLSKENKHKVLAMIALERFRYSIKYCKVNDGLINLINTKVTLFEFLRYIIYILHRAVTKKSYGFRI
ncbi:MAG: glycosyltransferase family 2 protein [Acetobacterium sp.]|uniref:glycosyltransferase family 2 protein n=1 Tax=Acetobacterium sp. TaxID=1872094 RepID=UPI0032424EA8